MPNTFTFGNNNIDIELKKQVEKYQKEENLPCFSQAVRKMLIIGVAFQKTIKELGDE